MHYDMTQFDSTSPATNPDTTLTPEMALHAYARMINTLNVEALAFLLNEAFVYESQSVLSALTSKQDFLDYIVPNLITLRSAEVPVYAEMGMITAYGKNQSCVILAQGSIDNLVGIALAITEGSTLKRIDLCVIPPPQAAVRSGVYPQ